MARTVIPRQADFSIGLRNLQDNSMHRRAHGCRVLVCTNMALLGVYIRVRETLKVVLAHRLACCRGGSHAA
jgi:hypothetical protein